MSSTVRACWPWLRARAGARLASILIVDDDVWVRAFVNGVMRDAGYTTVLARDGEEALAISEQIGRVDLLVTDELIRRGPGHGLARQLWQRDPNLKVLYLTGSRDRLFFSEKVALWESEAFVDQPSTVTELLRAVSLLLNSSPRHLCRAAVHRLDVKRISVSMYDLDVRLPQVVRQPESVLPFRPSG
jgi:DNA-binding NtrC family response regulator